LSAGRAAVIGSSSSSDWIQSTRFMLECRRWTPIWDPVSLPLKPSSNERDAVPEIIRVQAARIPDRDRLLELLSDHGHDARAVDEVEIDVYVKPGEIGAEPEIYSEAEDAVLEIGDSFVPIKHEGVIYVRPPIG
jgi:hypothetical protein